MHLDVQRYGHYILVLPFIYFSGMLSIGMLLTTKEIFHFMAKRMQNLRFDPITQRLYYIPNYSNNVYSLCYLLANIS